MDKKVTIQDVADAAGVSKTTVSFILNGRDDLRISEQTKKKVWQVINMLNYRPNLYAKNLRGTKTNKVIGFFQDGGLSELEKLCFYDFFDRIARILLESGQRAQLLLSIDRFDDVDAIVAKGLPKRAFIALAERNYIPVVAGDCRVDDPIFYEVNLDYPALKAQADAAFPGGCVYVCTRPRDDCLSRQLTEAFPEVRFVETCADLGALSGLEVFVTEPALKGLLTGVCGKVFCPEGLAERQARQILSCVALAVSREARERHDFLIR